MRKLVIIFMLVGIANIVRAQSPINSIYKEIREKWEQYNKDSITIEVGRMLDLFEKGGVFTQDIVEKKYMGLVYVLSDDEDCTSVSCSDPAVFPAVWYGTDQGICMMGLRTRGILESKRPLSNYVEAYLKRMPIVNESATRYAVMTDFSNGLAPYEEEDQCFVIDNNGSASYVRKNGDYIIGLSISYDKSNIMISVFDVTGQEKLLNLESFLENSTPQSAQYSEQTKQKLENLRAEEKERNEFSEMIEAIVNSKKLSTYYHNRDMFILSSGLFRDDLEVKYGNKDMLILSMPLDGITDYIEFTQQTFDGETNHPVIFEFNIRKEGCYGSATFNYEKGEWVLDSIQVVEN